MTIDDPDNLNDEELRQRINLETGQLNWSELQRYFARGVVILIDPQLDLVDVAVAFSNDDTPIVERWMKDKLIQPATDEDALSWQDSAPQFWSVVVAPWVLIQLIQT